MKKFIEVALAVILSMSICSCTNNAQSTATAAPSESIARTAEPTEEPTPEPTADLTLNADAVLDGMEYKYNSTWNETSDPLANATLRTYDIDLGSDGTIQLRLAAVNDEGTSTAVQNLRTQSDADREAVINSMLVAKEGTLTDSTSERAATPPSGTRAMWAYEGKADDGQSVHGYSYVGGSQLYEVSVTGSEEAYTAFESTWRSLINQLKFQEIEPIETPAPTPEPTPKPTPEPTEDSEPGFRYADEEAPNGGNPSNWASIDDAIDAWYAVHDFAFDDYVLQGDGRYVLFTYYEPGFDYGITYDRATREFIVS